MLAPDPGDIAYPALGDEAAGELRGGGADVIEADHVDDAGGLGGLQHRAAIVDRGTEGRFAEDVLAEGGGRLRDFEMGLGG